MKKHKHGLIGALICRTIIPCPVEISNASEELRRSIQVTINAERAHLYDLIDNGDTALVEDELLSLFARNGSTDKGKIRRVYAEVAEKVIDEPLAEALHQAGVDRKRIPWLA